MSAKLSRALGQMPGQRSRPMPGCIATANGTEVLESVKLMSKGMLVEPPVPSKRIVKVPAAMLSFTQPINAVIVGASRGIGLALARALLAKPSVERVFATSRHASSDETLGRLASDSDARLRALVMDVTVEESVAEAAAVTGVEAAHVNLIVNCAGLLHDGAAMQPEKRLADVTPASLQRSFAVNALGPLLVGKHFQHLFDRQGRAVFASLSARVGSIGDNRLGGWYAYRTAKAAQNMVTRNLAIELRRRARGLICVALHPGTVDTGLSRPFQSNVPQGRLFSPERAARQLLQVIDGLQEDDNGGFFAWDGQPIPW